MQLERPVSRTPTMKSELLLSAQLGVSRSEPSISEPAVSKDLEIELSMGTSEARARRTRTYSKCTERVSRAPRLCKFSLTEVENCEKSAQLASVGTCATISLKVIASASTRPTSRA